MNLFLSVYDGTVQSYIEEKEKEIVIDDFTRKRPLPFRLIKQEAFYHMKAIIDYALNTNDSIVLTLKDEGKDFLMELTINMPNHTTLHLFTKYGFLKKMIYHTAIAGKCNII